MPPRTLLIVTLCATAAWAQDPTPPPLVSPDPAPPAAAACQSYADCSPGLTCHAGACEPSCSVSADCGTGLHCVGRREVVTGKWTRGICRSGLEGDTCEGSRDCGGRLACTGRRRLTDGSGFESFCQDATARAGGRRAGEADRFEYKGTVPEGFHLVSERSIPLLGGGAAALAGGYFLALFVGLATNTPLGAIPLVGPIFVGASWWTTGAFSGFSNFLTVLVCGVDLIAQGAGIVMLSIGLASPKRWLERNVATRPTLTFAPGAPGSPLGASLIGRF